MTPVSVKIARIGDHDLPLPAYETAGAAGMDLRACLDDTFELEPGARKVVPTGFRVAIPDGYELQIRPRSGLALKHGITLPNTPGTIDSDYRGPLGVLLVNFSDRTFFIHHGDRIAQAILAPVTRCGWVETDTLDDTDRGAGGFGSTGMPEGV